MMRRMGLSALLCACVWLTSCAAPWVVDSQVQAFSGLASLPAEPSYRFERLPSQQSPQQSQLESLADAALFKAGLRRNDAAPLYSVQVGARVQRMPSPWADPWDEFGMGSLGLSFAYGPSWGRGSVGTLFRYEQPWYQREVSVVVRELASNRVVFESRAQGDGPWSDSAGTLAAMFDAALQGFPNPPLGVRRISVQVVPAAQAAPAAPVVPATPAPAQ
jgi:hypothetical protein